MALMNVVGVYGVYGVTVLWHANYDRFAGQPVKPVVKMTYFKASGPVVSLTVENSQNNQN